jgi:hypothetical protein
MLYGMGYDTEDDYDEACRQARRNRQAAQLAQAQARDPDLDFELSDFNADEDAGEDDAAEDR